MTHFLKLKLLRWHKLPVSLFTTFILMTFLFVKTTAKCGPDELIARVFSSIENSLEELREGRLRELPTARADLNAISSSLETLRRVVVARESNSITSAYVEALDLDSKLLETIVHEKSISDQLTKLSDVRSSLEVKASYAGSAKGAELRLVQLIITTVQKNNEVNNYEVWYVPKGWRDVQDKFRRFDDLSSPSIKDLAPGNYIVWLQLSGATVSEHTLVSLGEDGKSKRRVTLTVR